MGMLETEYVRNCNCNYERIHLKKKPEEKRYQYCILNRGGIRYLLPGSLRYINGEAYLYYDISSIQNIKQLFELKKIGRDWFRDFLWGIKKMFGELDRFLLEEQCIIWNPIHVFQDLESNDFSFLYVPYYQEDNGLWELMDYFIEKIDYEDDALVDFFYSIYEQMKSVGLEYFRKQIHEVWDRFEREEAQKEEEKSESERIMETCTVADTENLQETEQKPEKRGWGFWKESRRKKNRKKEDYREHMRQKIFGVRPLAVCEETMYDDTSTGNVLGRDEVEKDIGEEEYGRTIYIEDTGMLQKPALYKGDGEMVAKFEDMPFVIGKRKDDVSLALNDYSVSRIHARITEEEGVYYIEDLNSTNGTYKNGLRLQPYEKRKLEREDELRFGKTEYIYK